jgi:transketolase
VGPCYAYDIDGPTHHASEDIAILRSLSNMHIYSPSDAENCATAADEIVKIRQPVYCRLDRGKYPILGRTGPNDLKRGFRVFGEGQDVCLIATGSMVHVAIKVAEYLKEQNINARVLDLFRIKPINNNSLASALEGIHHLVTIEEHTIHGGIGSVISEFVTDNRIKTKLKRMAIDDSRLYAYGNRNLLLKKRGLDANSITNDVLSFIEMA